MRTPAVFLLLLGLAACRAEEASDKVNQLETRNVPQVTKPAGMETASTRNGGMQIAHMQYQPNRLDNQELNFQQLQNNIQTQAPQFYSQNQVSQMRTQELNQQLQAQNLAQLQNQAEAQLRQLRQQTQIAAGSPPVRQEQEMSTLMQPQQQRMTPAPVSTTVQTETPKEQQQQQQQIQTSQQLYTPEVPQEQTQPQTFYQDRRNMVEVQREDTSNERRFDDSTTRQQQQQNQILNGVQSTAVRTGGFSQVFPQRSAFDNRQQPIVLPGVSQTHSTSVVVSGLKNLPVLPALVYSAAPVPSSHALAYGRPFFQGGAYIKQHFQTPYARYVYSHIL